MENDFSLLEMRMIQRMITKYPVADIAELVERPVQVVNNYINHFVEGKDIITCQQRIDEKEKIKKQQKDWKILKKKKAQAEQDDILARKKELVRIKRAREHEAIQKRKRAEPVLKTRSQNFSKMRSIRIDHKTIIFVKPDQDLEQIRKKYLQDLKFSAPVAANSKNVEVKKFKPIK